jgi:hypothetical protein
MEYNNYAAFRYLLKSDISPVRNHETPGFAWKLHDKSNTPAAGLETRGPLLLGTTFHVSLGSSKQVVHFLAD